MDKERFMKVIIINNNINELVVDVNSDHEWEKIMNQKDKILKIETLDWTWNLLTNEVVFQ